MNIYTTLLDDDTYESVKMPADLVQLLDEQSSLAKMSRETFMREALHQYVTGSKKPARSHVKKSDLAYT